MDSKRSRQLATISGSVRPASARPHVAMPKQIVPRPRRPRSGACRSGPAPPPQSGALDWHCRQTSRRGRAEGRSHHGCRHGRSPGSPRATRPAQPRGALRPVAGETRQWVEVALLGDRVRDGVDDMSSGRIGHVKFANDDPQTFYGGFSGTSRTSEATPSCHPRGCVGRQSLPRIPVPSAPTREPANPSWLRTGSDLEPKGTRSADTTREGAMHPEAAYGSNQLRNLMLTDPEDCRSGWGSAIQAGGLRRRTRPSPKESRPS